MAGRLKIPVLLAALVAVVAVVAVVAGAGVAPWAEEEAGADLAAKGEGHEHGAGDDHEHGDEEVDAKEKEELENDFTYGFEARISGSAVEPADLVSSVNEDIRLYNDTAAPVEVEFLNWFPNGDDHSRRVPIAPGEAFVINSPSLVSIVYEVVGRPELRGSVLIESGQM